MVTARILPSGPRRQAGHRASPPPALAAVVRPQQRPLPAGARRRTQRMHAQKSDGPLHGPGHPARPRATHRTGDAAIERVDGRRLVERVRARRGDRRRIPLRFPTTRFAASASAASGAAPSHLPSSARHDRRRTELHRPVRRSSRLNHSSPLWITSRVSPSRSGSAPRFPARPTARPRLSPARLISRR